MKTFLFLILTFALTNISPAQISLSSDDFPSTVGMEFITEDDTSKSIPVNVGLPGENQTWVLDHSFPCIHSTQNIIDISTTPYSTLFSGTNLITGYEGLLGSQINSYYFDQIAGTFHIYQEKTLSSIVLKGIGVKSSAFTGPIKFEPEILYFSLPLEFGKNWNSASNFSISIDTVFFGIPATIIADVKDSIDSIVDGWGTLKLPQATFNCLRVKSYITLDEKLYVSGEIFKEHKSRTINYFWITEKYGVVAKVISQLDETDDNFTNAAQISRFYSFSSSSRVSKSAVSQVKYHLFSNYPNPFNATTMIPFRLNAGGNVSLEIFNLMGQRIKTLTNDFYEAGTHQISWNGTNSMNEAVPSGVYFFRMNSTNGMSDINNTELKKAILIR